MLFDIPFIADWKTIGEHRQKLIDRNTDPETKAELIMITKLVRITCTKQRYNPQCTVPVAKRPMDNYDSPYEISRFNAEIKKND